MKIKKIKAHLVKRIITKVERMRGQGERYRTLWSLEDKNLI